MPTITLEDLQKFEGERIDAICDCAYHNNAENHCAHFVSHALGLHFGFTCKNMTGKGAKGANIRVQEIFARCCQVGKWSDRPAHLMVCLAFVTSVKNVNLAIKQMDNVPKKHIGIYNFGSIWHYSNTADKVVKQSPEQFARHYAGSDIGVFYGEIPT
jgi:hypothetical protein